jgi:hypothetical protein
VIDRTDLETCRVGLLWIQRHRQLHRQPASPVIDRAISNLEDTLACSASGTNDAATQQNWVTTTTAAKRLGCSPRYVRQIAERLGGRKDGRDWLIPEGAL